MPINWMQRIKLLLLIRVFLISTLILKVGIPYGNAQISHLSTYSYNPLLLNPASTGYFNGIWRAAATYRNQSSVSGNTFSTIAVSGDTKLPILKEKLSVGAYVLSDNAGVGNINSNKLYGSVAYVYTLGKNYIRGGVQAGYVTSEIGTWGNWDYATHSYTASNGESGIGESIGYLDMNAGISWNRKFGLFEPKAGIAFAHLNTPNTSFLQGENKEAVSTTILVQSTIDISERIILEPAFIISDAYGIQPTMLGINGAYLLPGNTSIINSFNAGLHIRNGITDKLSTVTALAGVRIRTFDFIVAYDINMADYSTIAGSKGAFEVSVVYHQLPIVLNTYTIPCERY